MVIPFPSPDDSAGHAISPVILPSFVGFGKKPVHRRRRARSRFTPFSTVFSDDGAQERTRTFTGCPTGT
jgi:hypothetical protein